MSAPPPTLAWLDAPRAGRGIDFGPAGRVGYDRLARDATDVAAGLTGDGVGPGQAVAVVASTGPDFVAAAYGVLLAGAALVPLPPPLRMQDRDAYARHTAALLAAAAPTAVLVPDQLTGMATVWHRDGVDPRTVGAVRAA
ncbi:MAG: AMP-binding protein, partial [Actinocatenispora sp.]